MSEQQPPQQQPTGPLPLGTEQGKAWLNTIALHDVAEKMQINRAGQAAGWGLDPREWAHPFGSTNVTLPGMDTLKTAAVTLGSALLGGLGTFAGMSLLPTQAPPEQPAAVAPAEPQPPQTAQAPAAKPQAFDVTIEAVDGNLTVTDVTEVKEPTP